MEAVRLAWFSSSEQVLDLKLEGQTVVVTGGASGIGKAISLAFARQGCHVAVLDIHAETRALGEELERLHQIRALALNVDVTDYSAVCDAKQQVLDKLDGCMHVVCAAGVGSGKYGFPFWNLEPRDWRRVLEVNLMGAVNIAHAFAPGLVQASRGSMLFLSSVAGQIGSQTDPPYSAAKAAVINFAQCAAKDLARFNVRANTICPGMVRTPLNQSVWRAWNKSRVESEQRTYEQWAQEKISQITPLGRWQEPEDIAALAVFLASDQAKNITGQTLNVDGGQVMHS